MRNLKNEGLETMETKVRSIKGWRMIFALSLVAGFAALAAVVPPQSALADKGGGHGHTFDVTFTKWITSFPNMEGVVGDDAGDGTFAGEILNIGTVGDITSIEALYHINGSRHSFTAHNYITQNNLTNMASITGRVTEGWLKGAPLTGEYMVLPVCPIPTPGNANGTLCFQGTLHIHRGSEE